MDEVRDSKTRPRGKVTLQLNRRIVLPLEGKGDRSAVDEVTCRPAPLRGALKMALGKGSINPLSKRLY